MAYTTIDDPSAYFQTTLYTGNDTDDTAITNTGNSDLQPDMVWIKERSSTSSHFLTDSSRGAGTVMYPDTEVGEGTNTQLFTSFDSDGFTVGDTGQGNDDGETYVAWQWKCNGGTTETAVNESGDNPANVRQTNATAGFSIITSTGTGGAGTIAHGLGAVPHFMISKCRSDSGGWVVYHQSNTSAPETDAMNLATNDATSDSAVWFNDTAPTSSVFTLGTTNDLNGDARTYVHYVFTSIQGYSKFGGYTGNGSTDGIFLYLGFKPAFIIVKATDTDNWRMYDHKRSNPFNLINVRITADLNNAESQDDNECDFLSNGIKWHSSSGGVNSDGQAYVFMAWAKQPFVTSAGVPCTAR